MTKCSPVEVVPRIHANCTEEIPVTINGTDAFMDPISYVIKSAGSLYTATMSPRLGIRLAASGTVATRS